MKFERSYFQQLITHIKEPRSFIQVLMGPRQVGKTTLISQVLAKVDIRISLFLLMLLITLAKSGWNNNGKLPE